MRRLLPWQYGGGSAYCAPLLGSAIRLRNAPYLALRAQYGLRSAAISLSELNTPAAPPIAPPSWEAQYGYAMRPISPYGLNTGARGRGYFALRAQYAAQLSHPVSRLKYSNSYNSIYKG